MLYNQAQKWQKDPNQIDTQNVQLWNENNVMLTAKLSTQEAREMIDDGRCFVITGQAIGFYDTVEKRCVRCDEIFHVYGKHETKLVCDECNAELEDY